MAGNSSTNLNSSGASPTFNPHPPTVLIAPYSYSKDFLPPETYFESLVNCVSTIPTPVVCCRASISTKRTIPAAIGSEQSHDQLLPEKANTFRQKHNEISSNIRGYSKLNNFFLAAFQPKRPASVKGLAIPKSLVCTTKLDTEYKDIIPSRHNHSTIPQSW
jgi:hypothetical protein